MSVKFQDVGDILQQVAEEGELCPDQVSRLTFVMCCGVVAVEFIIDSLQGIQGLANIDPGFWGNFFC